MLNMLNLFTGIDGLGLGALRTGQIKTQFAVDNDPFNKKFIERNLGFENAGDINHVCVSEEMHPAQDWVAKDEVPVEQTGLSPLCMDDFYQGTLDYPDFIVGGFPCVSVSSANVHNSHLSIDGKGSDLVHEQLRIVEKLEAPYVVFENVARLRNKGLEYLLSELSRMGYNAQWGMVAAVGFGYAQYRHRMFVIGYLPDSELASRNGDVFGHIKTMLQDKFGYGDDLPDNMDFRMVLPNEDPLFLKDFATVENTRSILNRTKRINGLGNTVIPDVAEAVFDAILHASNNFIEKPLIAKRNSFGHWVSLEDKAAVEMPYQGYMIDGQLYSCESRCKILNPTNRKFSGLWSTLIRKDGNNCFNPSRLRRKGKLGGVVADVMRVTGVTKGGLCPEFCEHMMGFDIGYTELRPK